MNYLITTFFMFGLLVTVWSSCHFTPRVDDDSDTCDHPEFPGFDIKIGSSLTTPTCLNVTCFKGGMSVCEYGWRLARLVGLPSECKKVKVGKCGVKFVKKEDESVLCFENEDLEYNSV
ncbi:hypothetical protein ACF0H5_022154 [Mactra antiquata]